MTLLTIQVKGGEEFARVLNNSPKITRPHLADALNESAFFLEGQAKVNAPIREGRLRGSITTVQARPGKKMRALVGTNLKYALFQEFGTGVFAGGSPIRPVTARVLRFKTRGGSVVFTKRVKGVRATKFMQRARDATKPVLERNLKKALDNITRDLAIK